MKFYHGTTKDAWNKIKKENTLWGIRTIKGYNPSRCTYLTPFLKNAKIYGSVILQVEWDPECEGINNFCDNCWQFREYAPIPLDRVVLINE